MKFPVIWQTPLLLTASTVFMTFAWYTQPKPLNDRPWWITPLISWSIALFEYLLQLPAKHIGMASNNVDATPSRQPFGTASVGAHRNVAATSLAPPRRRRRALRSIPHRDRRGHEMDVNTP